MGIRRTYQFNCDSAGRRDGMYLKDPCDIHFRQLSGYDVAPYGLDCDASSRLQLGDRIGSRPNSGSLPIEVVGGFHHKQKNISNADSPYTITADDYFLLVDTSAGNVIINLPAISSNPGKCIKIKKTVAANIITINRAGADTIESDLASRIISSHNYSYALFADNAASTWRQAENDFNRQEAYFNMNQTGTINNAAYQTLATTGSIFFSGRPCVFFLNGVMRNAYGSNELMEVDFGLRIDTGTEVDTCVWTSDLANNHASFAGVKILTPTRGSHTIGIRWKRVAGAGTGTIDVYDFLSLQFIDL